MASDWSWSHLNIGPAPWLEVVPLWKTRGNLTVQNPSGRQPLDILSVSSLMIHDIDTFDTYLWFLMVDLTFLQARARKERRKESREKGDLATEQVTTEDREGAGVQTVLCYIRGCWKCNIKYKFKHESTARYTGQLPAFEEGFSLCHRLFMIGLWQELSSPPHFRTQGGRSERDWAQMDRRTDGNPHL